MIRYSASFRCISPEAASLHRALEPAAQLGWLCVSTGVMIVVPERIARARWDFDELAGWLLQKNTLAGT